MPIHDQGYRHYAGARLARGSAWSIIAGHGIRTFLAKRGFIALLLLAWLPFFGRAIQIYAAASLPQAAFLAMTPTTFRQFLAQQDVFVFFVTVYVGGGLIANDRRANALQIYLSKPLTRTEYVLGKLAILMTFLLAITFVPAILLLMVQAAFAGNLTFVRSNLYLFPAITLYTSIEALMGGMSMLALSSLSKSSRYVAILYAGLIFFSQAMFGVLKAATGQAWWSFMSLANDLSEVGDLIFQIRIRGAAPWPVALFMVAALIVVSGLVLERRVRGVDVVA
jgi:ABC-type transport system involved in multi-copper enzyme maturation permease subunit